MRRLTPITLVACMLATAVARADVITFDVSGSYTAISTGGGTFSGTMTVDTTTGNLPAVNISFPGVGTVDLYPAVGPEPNVADTAIQAENEVAGLLLILDFTAATPGSLVGFDGGTINGGILIRQFGGGGGPLLNLTGSITAPAPAPTPAPEPSSLLLLASALGCLGTGVRHARREHR